MSFHTSRSARQPGRRRHGHGPEGIDELAQRGLHLLRARRLLLPLMPGSGQVKQVGVLVVGQPQGARDRVRTSVDTC